MVFLQSSGTLKRRDRLASKSIILDDSLRYRTRYYDSLRYRTLYYDSLSYGTRYYCTRNEDKDIIPNCTLNQLAKDIEEIYRCFGELFPEITTIKLGVILKSVMDGRYRFTPPRVNTLSNIPLYEYKYKETDDLDMLKGVYLIPEDELVLMALGLMLNTYFNKENLFMDKSLGLRIHYKDYYNTVCVRSNILRLYKIDLKLSMRTKNRETLLSKLSHIVKDGEIMRLVENFLYLSVQDELDRYYTVEIGCNLIKTPIICSILSNYALIEFDEAFHHQFPLLEFSRYLHEVLVYIPTTSGCEDKFEQQVLNLFEQHHLEGDILSIGPGEEPMICYGALVSVSQECETKVEIYE